jgi:hypothetical protein
VPTSTQLRSDVGLLVDEALGELEALWRQAETASQIEAALRDTLPDLIDTYGAAVATTAANWYDDLRLERGVRGRFTAIPAEVRETGSQALVGWALATAHDVPSFQSLVEGGTQRRLANFSRFTIGESAIQDPQAQGWIRVGFGECNWCKQYLDGEVRTVSGYDFDAHDNCKCDAVPAF